MFSYIFVHAIVNEIFIYTGYIFNGRLSKNMMMSMQQRISLVCWTECTYLKRPGGGSTELRDVRAKGGAKRKSKN